MLTGTEEYFSSEGYHVVEEFSSGGSWARGNILTSWPSPKLAMTPPVAPTTGRVCVVERADLVGGGLGELPLFVDAVDPAGQFVVGL
jgi:hypothetical protein